MGKFKIEDISQEAKTNGWKLISKEYVNLDSPLNFQCPEGHTTAISLKKWRKTHECPVCKANPLFNIPSSISQKKNSEYRILALDQATNISGWSLFDDTTLKQYGIFKTQMQNEEDKINEVREWLITMITNFQPDFVIIEDIQLQQHGGKNYTDDGDNIIGVTTYKVLAHLQGVICNLLLTLKIPHEIVPPGTWRKYCKIRGQYKADKKKSAQLLVKDEYDISVTNDEADAICIGKYGAHTYSKNMEIISWE